ncbi:hypothetical protein Nocox_39190 [Nonomuraea coxensis DSM 45129]|uniref:Uncharacterized protein n=1 Tax=Nonomuraea coxensis DSM 45129 TaxID=1122611 RepID=A0ABX8UFX4_9ACTN|nr:hypothetical protein [Nonomuraea coxensis]QYC45388.1 hypothetical protein Nocox_39190 [Nonomuraea coxensis DSM 45129]
MNRVVKAAVAATAFGLAAALAVPAQAGAGYETTRNAPADGPGGGTGLAGGSPLGGLLGGLTGAGLGGGLGGGLTGGALGGGLGGGLTGGALGGGLLGGVLGGKSKPVAHGQVGSGLSEAEKDAVAAGGRGGAAGRAQTPNSAEDATRGGPAIPELSPIRSGIPLGGGGMTESLPVLTGGSSTAARQVEPQAATLNRAGADYGPFHLVTGLVKSASGAVGKVQGSGMLDSATLPALPGLPGTADGGGGGLPVGGAHGLSDQTLSGLTGGASPLDALGGPVTGLTSVPLNALSGSPLGALSGTPANGLLSAPARDFDSLSGGASRALPAAARSATVERLAPLAADAAAVVETNGTKALGGYNDVMTALGWTTDALTSSVRDTWNRG